MARQYVRNNGSITIVDRGEDGGYKVADEVHSNSESAFEENSPVHPGTARRTTSQGEQVSSFMHDSKNVPGDVSSKNSDMKWSHQPKDFYSQWENLDPFDSVLLIIISSFCVSNTSALILGGVY